MPVGAAALEAAILAASGAHALEDLEVGSAPGDRLNAEYGSSRVATLVLRRYEAADGRPAMVLVVDPRSLLDRALFDRLDRIGIGEVLTAASVRPGAPRAGRDLVGLIRDLDAVGSYHTQGRTRAAKQDQLRAVYAGWLARSGMQGGVPVALREVRHDPVEKAAAPTGPALTW